MNKLVGILGNVASVLGIVVCLAAGLARLTRSWYLAGYENMALFTVGVGLMVLGCLAKLHVLESK